VKGRNRFTAAEAEEIRGLLRAVRRAEPGTPQKLLRDQLRALRFYISDWGGGPLGFTSSDFDELISAGLVTIADEAAIDTADRPRPARPQRQLHESAGAGDGNLADELADAACAALRGPGTAIPAATEAVVSNRPGLYALHGEEGVWLQLGLGERPDGRPLYVGKAERSLLSRDLKQHFATGKTGSSSPRRSFAALLAAAGVLKLVAMPRRPADPEPDKWTHYALEEPGDRGLTDWMLKNLTIAVWEAPPGIVLADVEKTVMRRWKPPLNLSGVTTPWKEQVLAARAVMARRAEKWSPPGRPSP